MLFDNADDALKAESDIVSGKPFDQVYDTWHEKAKQAKSFTHVRKDQVPDELAKALAELKNGESTKTAVKTDFGWHVVHLVSANPFTPPPFEQVKDSVRQTLLLQVGRERLQKLKEQAKIEYPPGSAPPASKRADAKPTTTDNAVEKAIDAAKKH
jgi:peptidyl-prolyl cis-trans isomerase C